MRNLFKLLLVAAALIFVVGSAHAQQGVSIQDGGDVTQGAKADAVCGTATGSCSSQALYKFIAQSVSSAIPAGTNVIGFTSNDPCAQIKNTTVAISQTANTTIIAGTSAKKTYICSIAIIAGAAETIDIITGTGSACVTTQTAALMGSTTTANGVSLAANGGLTLGNGSATVMGGLGNTADNVCLMQAASSRISGTVTYVQQ